MAWFRKKGKYWYFVERINDKEIQHYIGDDQVVKDKLLPNKKLRDLELIKKSEKIVVEKKERAADRITRPGNLVTA